MKGDVCENQEEDRHSPAHRVGTPGGDDRDHCGRDLRSTVLFRHVIINASIIVKYINNVPPNGIGLAIRTGLMHYNGDAVADLNIKAIETELQGYQELKRATVTLDNRVLAYELVYKWTPVKDGQVYQRVIYILINKTGRICGLTNKLQDSQGSCIYL